MTDTIVALATPAGRAAIAVVRLSGPQTWDILSRLGATPLKPRRASLRRLTSADGDLLDQAIVLGFAAPHSYTGEDAAELHLHGGEAVIDGVIREVLFAGARLAAAGEFSRRAVENGRLQLEQAEAVADLVDAETEAQARQAAAQLDGALGRRYSEWRGRLVGVLALLEAAVDFPDEDLPTDLADRCASDLGGLIDELGIALADGRRGEQVRSGYRIALIGAPNAGKSSLLNAVCGRAAAIVAPTAGTTRDVVEVALEIEGRRVLLADTAGLRTGRGAVESEGVRRAQSAARSADLRLWVVDRSARAAPAGDLLRPGDLLVLNKSDLPERHAGREARLLAMSLGMDQQEVSAVSGELTPLLDWLSARLRRDLAGADFPAVTRERHRLLLDDARGRLESASGHLAQPEMAAEDVRLAARSLAMVTGQVGVEDVLDELFAGFCIGK